MSDRERDGLTTRRNPRQAFQDAKKGSVGDRLKLIGQVHPLGQVGRIMSGNQSITGAIGETFDFGRELARETISQTGETLSADRDAPVGGGAKPGGRSGVEGEGSGATWEDFRDVVGISNVPGWATKEFDMSGPEQVTAFQRQIALDEERVNNRLDIVDRSYGAIDAMMKEGNLSPTGQAALQELMDTTTQQLDMIDMDSRQIMSNIALSEALLNPEGNANPEDVQTLGIAPEGSDTGDVLAQVIAKGGITPEMAADQGVGRQQFNELAARGEELLAATDAGENVEGELDELSVEAAEVAAANNLASEQNQFEFQMGMRSRLRDLTEQRRTVVENEQQITEAIAAEDIAQATKNWDFNFVTDPDMAYANAFGKVMVPFIEGENLPPAATEAFRGELEAIEANLPPGKLDFSDPALGQAQQALMDLGENYGIDPSALLQNFEAARAAGSDDQEAMENVWDKPVFKPGSLGLSTAIFQTANDALTDPTNPDAGFAEANAMANSPSMHTLIDLASGGKVGASKGGTMFGLGGLPSDIYESMGYDPKTVKGDPQVELEALVRFVDSYFNGDASAALSHFAQNKGWKVNSG